MNMLPFYQYNMFNMGKEQIEAYADELVATKAEEGWDTTELLAQAAKVQLFAARLIERAKIAAISDVRAYGKGGVMRSGVVLTVRASGGKLDYTSDPVWQSLNAVTEHAKGRLKQHQELLKAVPYDGCLMLNEDTAELYTAHPPAKSSGDTIYMEIK